jgi:hypothetical protein
MEPRQAALLRQIRGPAAVQQNFLRSVLPRAEKDRGAIRTPQATPEADEAAPARVGRGIRGVPYYPVRQSLGAVLLQAGRPMQAERMFHEALREHPNSAWAPGHSSVSRRRNGRKATRQPRPQRSGSSIPSGRATAGKLRYRCCRRAFGESPIRTRKPDCDATMSSSLAKHMCIFETSSIRCRHSIIYLLFACRQCVAKAARNPSDYTEKTGRYTHVE